MWPFDYTAVAGSGKVGPVNQVNHTSWVAIVTTTDRPKSVRSRSVIELFAALLVLSFCPFDISVGVGAFVIGLSQISSFFSLDPCDGVYYSPLYGGLFTFWTSVPSILEGGGLGVHLSILPVFLCPCYVLYVVSSRKVWHINRLIQMSPKLMALQGRIQPGGGGHRGTCPPGSDSKHGYIHTIF